MVVSGSKRGSATYGGSFKGELIASFPACVSSLLCETAFVGRHDARLAACCSLTDFFDTADVERGAATIVFTGRLGRADSSFHFASLLERHKSTSCPIASLSLCNSGSSSSAVPKSAGIVEGVETSLEAAIMLDQQLTTAFQTGLRHSLDDSDHDAMSDLSEK